MGRNKKSKGAPQVKPVTARTPKQRELFNAIASKEMVITLGSAGTGKTYVPTALAADAFMRNEIDKIVLSRPNVGSGRTLGHRPGDLIEKLWEWFAEIMDILAKRMGRSHLMNEVGQGRVEMVPFETMRGRSFNNAFVLLDEAQNTEYSEMKMFCTRLGEGISCVVNGDVTQSDLRRSSGLKNIIEISKMGKMDIPIIEFGHEDIVRSELCKQWIVNFEKWEKR